MKKEEFFTHVTKADLLEQLRRHPTPVYLFFEHMVAKRIAEVRSCLPASVALHYAIKANPHPAVLAVMNKHSLGGDVASNGELRAAMAAGFLPQRIEYSGPGKTEADLTGAIEAEVGCINVESVAEIEALIRVANRLGRRPRVGVRVNPNSKSKGGIRMAGATQFGVSEDDAADAIGMIASSSQLHFAGLHVHTGSQFLAASALVENMGSILELALKLEADGGHALEKVNFGGGWGLAYFPHQNPLCLDELAQGIRELFAQPRFAKLIQKVNLIVEPGRYLIGESGVYVATVLYRKKVHGIEYAIVDGGMHHCYLLAGGIGQMVRRNFEMDIIRINSGDRQPRSFDMNIAGVLCMPQDLLASQFHSDHEVESGDRVVFFNCGAYGLSASPYNFLRHEPPMEIMVPA